MSDKIKNIAVTVCFSLFLILFLLWGIILKDSELSLSERRPLAKMPELSVKTIANGEFMSGFETYSVDQFPIRDTFRGLKAVTSFYVLGQKDSNGIYIKNGIASRLEYPLNQKSVDYAVNRIRNIYDLYLKDNNTKAYICIVPDKNLYLAEKYGYPSLDYESFRSAITEPIADFATSIDIYDLLDESDYFATDIHWREEKIVDVAKRITERMGTSFFAQFEEVRLDVPFYGVYYGQSALPLPADSISYLTNPAIENAVAFDFESSSEIPVYSMELANGKDPYEMYLCGSRSLITIENPAAVSDKELIIFRDSFGSSIAPLLTDSYKKITLVDIRYLRSDFVGSFVEFSDQDVLFLYSVPVLNNSETMK